MEALNDPLSQEKVLRDSQLPYLLQYKSLADSTGPPPVPTSGGAGLLGDR